MEDVIILQMWVQYPLEVRFFQWSFLEPRHELFLNRLWLQNRRKKRGLLQYLQIYELAVDSQMQPSPILLIYMRSEVVAIKAFRQRTIGFIFTKSTSDRCLMNLRGWRPTLKIKSRSWRPNIRGKKTLSEELTYGVVSTWLRFDRMRSIIGGSEKWVGLVGGIDQGWLTWRVDINNRVLETQLNYLPNFPPIPLDGDDDFVCDQEYVIPPPATTPYTQWLSFKAYLYENKSKKKAQKSQFGFSF